MFGDADQLHQTKPKMMDPIRRNSAPGTGHVLGRNLEYCYFQVYAELGHFPYRRVVQEAEEYWDNNPDWKKAEEEEKGMMTPPADDEGGYSAAPPPETKEKPHQSSLNLEEATKNLGINLGRVINGVQVHGNGDPVIGGVRLMPAPAPPMRYMPY